MKVFEFLFLWMLLGILNGVRSLSEVYPCNNNIYCFGELLETVQLAHIYPDSKTFVDMKLKMSPLEVHRAFDKMMSDTKRKPTMSDIRRFVDGSFDPPGSELEMWKPTDWHDNPAFLSKIQDSTLRKWAKEIHGIWKELGRRIKPEVEENQDRYSIIYVPNPAIVPGGRFREFYYWDSYWIVRGLLVSEMHETVRGMLENFFMMVDKYGFVPNGGRIYYERRSQPPFLISMVESYLEVHPDPDFLKANIDTLEKEFEFWRVNRTTAVKINGKEYRLVRYFVDVGDPRPESYREDYLLAENLTGKAKDDLYAELKSGAESGWDYSSRWFITDQSQGTGTILDLKTSQILPVDLNAYICKNARLLAHWFQELGNTNKSAQYENLANEWSEMIQEVFWHETDGIWYDYDLHNMRPRQAFYPSNMVPLWAGCYEQSHREEIAGKVVRYLRNVKALVYDGGVPTSLLQSGEQWDFPNSWPPLQHMMIFGLDGTGASEAQALARELAQKWIFSNWLAYKQYAASHPTGAMFEKYDATVVGLPGGGGEYDVQLGFGWSNGVVLDLLVKYGDYNLEMSTDGVGSLHTMQALFGPITLMGIVLSMATLFWY